VKKHAFYTALFSILFLSILAPPSYAQVKVSDVQTAIKAAGATWVAAENHITKLTPDAQARLLGVKNAPKATTRPPRAQVSAYGLPPSVDWRNNGGNYVTGIRDQAACGSCWAHAGIAALESATLIANKTPNTELNLSEQVLISCCSSICSPQGDCNGGYPEKAADFLRDKGAPAESCYPYVMNGTCPNACPNWQASAYKIKSWDYVVNYDQNEAASVDAIRAGLQNGPLATTYAVYSDFFYYTSGVYKRIYGGLAGYHAVLIVGYDDPGQYFIVKNSWGTDWGEQGYFRIAYSEVTGASQFGYETIAYHVEDDPNPTCDYALGDYFPGAGGTGTIQMSIDEFAWAAGTDDYWISTSQPYSMGSGPLNFTVAPNTTS
jgi:C1A family cysteine protease